MRAILLLIVVGLSSCATSGGLKPIERKDPFPKRETLAKIEAEPTPSGVFDKVDDVRVPHWTLADPLPDTMGPVPRTPQTELDAVAADVAGTVKHGVSTEAMHCLAHQLGEFYLAYGGQPEKSLKRFMEHRCGVTAEFTSASWFYFEDGNVPWEEADKDDRTSEFARKSFTDLAADLANPELGAWYGANDERSVAMLVVGSRAVDLEPMPIVPEGGVFEVAGEFFFEGVDKVGGVVNVGTYGWADCHALKAELPKFRVRCNADAADIDAGFEIYTMRKGDLIASSRLWQRMWPSGVAANKFVLGGRPEVVAVAVAPPAVEGEPMADEQLELEPTVIAPDPLEAVPFDTSPDAMREQMLARINELRAKGNLSPVTLAPKQSNVATQLAPHYWASWKAREQKKVEDIAFGLLAGWDVEGPIIDGSLYSVWVRGGPDDLVANLAERPGARDVLFGPEIATLSLGPHYDVDSKVMGGLVHGWEFVSEESHLRRVNRFLDYISEARAARDNPKPKKDAQLLSVTEDLAAKLEAGELQLHEVAYRLQVALAQRNPGRTTMVYYLEVHDPTKFEIPEEIIETVPLDVAVVVAPYRVPNHAWHTYGVAFAYVRTKSPTKVAAATRTPLADR